MSPDPRMPRTAILTGTYLALVISAHAGAQSLAWTSPLYAQVPPWGVAPFGAAERGALVDSPFMPSWDPNSRSVLLLSDVGEPGIVLAGRGQIDYVVIQIQPPGTPWLAKLARDDGRLLWTWHLDDYAEGRFSEATDDASSDILAVGTHWLSDTDFRPLVVKIDAATGALRWRADGPQRYFGLSIAPDVSGDVVVTATHDRVEQGVFKYEGNSGALLWSAGMPDASDWDDGLVAVDGDGNVIACGAYNIIVNSEVVESGLQIAKFRGDDGQMVWSRRFIGEFGGTAHAMGILPDGDIAFTAPFGDAVGLARLDGANGSVVWQRGDAEAEDMLVDPDGEIITAGYVNNPGPAANTDGDVQRIDASDGATLWRHRFPARRSAIARQLQIGADGQLLVALSDGNGFIPFGAAGIELATGALRWVYAPEVDHGSDDTFPVGIVQSSDGGIYFGGYSSNLPLDATWTTFKLDPVVADTIFLNGLD